MIDEISEEDLTNGLNRFVEDSNKPALALSEKLKGKTMSGFKLDHADFQTIKIQLRALGLITKGKKARSLRDIGSYWTLTPYGDEVMTRLRAIKREAVSDPVPRVAKKD